MTPEPSSLPDPEFYRRVLDHTPSAILVVDPEGYVRYANHAMARLVERTPEQLVGENVLHHVHDGDLDWIADAFTQIVAAPDAADLTARAPWAAIRLRLTAPDGSAVSVQVTGHGGIEDEHVGGVIYDVRDARDQELMGRVLRGIAAGAPVEQLLSIVMDMIVVPPLELDAAILQPDEDGRFRLVASTSPEFAAGVMSAGPGPWSTPAEYPMFHAVTDLPSPINDQLGAAGFVDLWHVAVASVLGASTFRIVVAASQHHEPATGVIDRLRRASELAGVVLLRAQTDEMLAHAASHDSLTRLPNRTGFRERVGRLRRGEAPVVVLYIDLDGFKAINDRHGHRAGDRVLAVIADRLRAPTGPE